MQPWERNDRLTRMLEWVEFYARCALLALTGSSFSYYASGLKQDHARLKAGRATYWYNPRAVRPSSGL